MRFLNSKGCRTAIAAVLAVSAGAATAFAQGAEEATPKTEEAAQEKQEGKVERVIVTGEKSSKSLQETPTSVSVTTAKEIEDENIQTFFDIVNRTANVSETYGPSGFTIRGISNDNVSGGGNGGLASVYVDNVPIPEQALFAGPLTMWDIAQVEILRGPQSTLQGRNALAGAVIIRSRDPSWDWEGSGRFIGSDAGDRAYAFAGGGPLIDDTLAFRVAVEDRHSDGFITNITHGFDAAAADTLNVRAKLLLKLPEVPDLTIRATYARNEHDSGYMFMYSRTDVPDYWHNRYDTSDSPNNTENVNDSVALEAIYDIHDRLSLTSISTWNTIDNVTNYDGDLGPLPISFGGSVRDTETITQELRLNYDGELVDGLLGVYFAKRDVASTSASLTNVETPLDTLVFVLQGPPFSLDPVTAQTAAGLYVAAMPGILVDYTSDAPQEVETSAIFGDARFAITPALSLLAGFRYDREDYTITSTQTAVFAGTYPDPTLYGPYAPIIGGLNVVVGQFVAQAGASAPKSTREFEAFLPKLGLSYDWTEDLTTSAIVQRGYRSGGSQINIARSTIVPYDPEFTWNYELSLRSTWLDGKLVANANAYYVDWTDQQVSVNLGLNAFDYQTENAGKSHLYGFEFELFHQPTDEFQWYAAVGYTQTQFDDFTVSAGATTNDLAGFEFAYAPHWTLSAGGTYEWDNGLFLNANASYRGDAFSDTGTVQSDWAIDARTLVNGKFGWRDEHWAAYLFANNLFDEAYIQYARKNENLALLGDPQVIGLIVETRW